VVGQPGEIGDVAAKPLAAHAVAGLLNSGCVDGVVLAESSIVDSSSDARVVTLARATSDAETVRAAVTAGTELIGDVDVVLVHDAASAFAPASVIESVVRALDAASVAIPALPMTDTVKRVDSAGLITGTVDRANLRVLQSPRGFRLDVLLAAAAHGWSPFDSPFDTEVLTDLGAEVRTVAGDPLAVPIRGRFDLDVLTALKSAT
jgi:2-C-methyl-D-erythritol 4-phosphate cytidylyltransferase